MKNKKALGTCNLGKQKGDGQEQKTIDLLEEKEKKILQHEKHAAKSGPSSSIASNSRLFFKTQKKNTTIKHTNKQKIIIFLITKSIGGCERALQAQC